MYAVILNSSLIILGGAAGLAFRHNTHIERYIYRMTSILSLLILMIGVQGALDFRNIFIVILSLILGTILGEALDIDMRFTQLSKKIEAYVDSKGTREKHPRDDFTKGFVDASLLYCVGSMAILGSFDVGLKGDSTLIVTKSIMDGLLSIILASRYGKGVLFSSLTVFLYQGILTMLAHVLSPLFTEEVLLYMSATGGILIIALALNVMEITKFKIANYIPVVFLPVILVPLFEIISKLI